MVEFTYATVENGVTLGITTTPTVAGSAANQTDLPNAYNQLALSFTAPSQHRGVFFYLFCCNIFSEYN